MVVVVVMVAIENGKNISSSNWSVNHAARNNRPQWCECQCGDICLKPIHVDKFIMTLSELQLHVKFCSLMPERYRTCKLANGDCLFAGTLMLLLLAVVVLLLSTHFAQYYDHWLSVITIIKLLMAHTWIHSVRARGGVGGADVHTHTRLLWGRFESQIDTPIPHRSQCFPC